MTTEYYNDGKVRLLLGDVRDCLKSIPDQSVHCVVTSPPYYGLRKYDGSPVLWGGDPACDHEWGSESSSSQRHSVGAEGGLHEGRQTNKLAEIVSHGTPASRHQARGFSSQISPAYVEEQRNDHLTRSRPTGNTPSSVEALEGGKSGAGDTVASTGAFCIRCGCWRGNLGNEPTAELYIQHLVEIFHEVKRTLRDDGTFWLNISDSYSSSGGAHKPEHANPGISNSADRDGVPLHWTREGRSTTGQNHRQARFRRKAEESGEATTWEDVRDHHGIHSNLEPLNLMGIPWRLALALQEDGWILRMDVVWAKNGMPESVSGTRWERCRVKVSEGNRKDGRVNLDRGDPGRPDVGGSPWNYYEDCPGCPTCASNDGYVLRKGSWRPTRAHEYIFMLVKREHYFSDQEAIREPSAASSVKRMEKPWNGEEGRGWVSGPQNHLSDYLGSERAIAMAIAGKNPRSVVSFPQKGLKDSHFASFPPGLPRMCVEVSTSQKGICSECGAPWARIVEHHNTVLHPQQSDLGAGHESRRYNEFSGRTQVAPSTTRTVGWRSTCGCDAPQPVPATVLDPFLGSGTTGLVARALGRHFVGCDLSEKYLQIAQKRITVEGRSIN